MNLPAAHADRRPGSRPMIRTAALLCAAACGALLLAGCSSGDTATPTSGPFNTGSIPAASPAVSANPSGKPTTRGTSTVTVTASSDPTGQSTSAPPTTQPPTTGPSSTEAPVDPKDRLNYDTTIPAPPTPIGATVVPTTPTETMRIVLPAAVTPAPFPPISKATRFGKPLTVTRKDPVQVAAAFVTLMESPQAMDSQADNATLRAAPLASDQLNHQLLIRVPQAALDRPPAGYIRVTVTRAWITRAVPTGATGATATSVTVAVLYDRLTLLTPSTTYNAQTFVRRTVVLDLVDGAWVVTGYPPPAN